MTYCGNKANTKQNLRLSKKHNHINKKMEQVFSVK